MTAPRALTRLERTLLRSAAAAHVAGRAGVRVRPGHEAAVAGRLETLAYLHCVGPLRYAITPAGLARNRAE